MQAGRFWIALLMVGGLTLPAAPAAGAAASMQGENESAYSIAIEQPEGNVVRAEPRAIPAVVAVGIAVGRGFTAAKAPQAATNVLRQGGFLQNFMGGAIKMTAGTKETAVDTIFDH